MNLLLSTPCQAQVNPRDCLTKTQYIATCNDLQPTVVCSPQLTLLCCGCQEIWATSFEYCQFNLALHPTPTPTPTATPTITPTPTVPIDGSKTPDPTPSSAPTLTPQVTPTFECGGGIDRNGDGLVDVTGQPCVVQETDDNCVDFENYTGAAKLIVGAQELSRLAMAAHRKLVRNAKLTPDRALGARLARSAKIVRKAIAEYEAQSVLSLAGYPSNFAVCPLSAPGCEVVDNSAAINAYVDGVYKLSNKGVHALNRATRLTSPTIKKARKRTRAHVKALRVTRDKLHEQAKLIPVYQSVCGGGGA